MEFLADAAAVFLLLQFRAVSAFPDYMMQKRDRRKSMKIVEEMKCDQSQEQVLVQVTGDAALAFGATDRYNHCVNYCTPSSLLSFLPETVTEGSCVDEGFTGLFEEGKNAQPPGSPFPIVVNVYFMELGASSNSSGGITGMEGIKGYYDTDWEPSVFTAGLCVNCREYENLNGMEKLDRIWEKIMAYEYKDELPTNWILGRPKDVVDLVLNEMFRDKRVNAMFDRVSDERPDNFPRIFHEYGSIAKVAWIPTTPNSQNKFTGLFSEGNEYGVIRMSFCSPGDPSIFARGLRLPFSFAAKFFRDGIHSANVLSCENIEGNESYYVKDAQDLSFFKHVQQSSTILPVSLARKAIIAQKETGVLSNQDSSGFVKNGTSLESEAVTPLVLHFFPNEALNTKAAYDTDFRVELLDIPSESLLYTAFTTVDDDGEPSVCICYTTAGGDVPCTTKETLKAKCNLVELGSLVTKSPFINSEYGDNGLFFQHNRACPEQRMYCEYRSDMSEEDPMSYFTASSEPNGTCVSQKNTDVYECPVLKSKDGSMISHVSTKSYCSSEYEQDAPTCPFAKSLDPAWSSDYGVYPIPFEDQWTLCDGLSSFVKNKTNPLTSLIRNNCCKAMTEYIRETKIDNEIPLQTLCFTAECKESFLTAFPDHLLDEVCSSAKLLQLKECRFGIKAGPILIRNNLGYLEDNCCNAIITHSDVAAEASDRENALSIICQEGNKCIAPYEDMFQQGQRFVNSSNLTSLAATCAAGQKLSKDTQNNTDDSGMKTGYVIGIVVAASVAVFVLICCLCFYRLDKKKEQLLRQVYQPRLEDIAGQSGLDKTGYSSESGIVATDDSKHDECKA